MICIFASLFSTKVGVLRRKMGESAKRLDEKIYYGQCWKDGLWKIIIANAPYCKENIDQYSHRIDKMSCICIYGRNRWNGKQFRAMCLCGGWNIHLCVILIDWNFPFEVFSYCCWWQCLPIGFLLKCMQHSSVFLFILFYCDW